MPKAQDIEKQAKSLSSVSLFALRFSIDHDQVAMLYEKAGNAYRSEANQAGAVRCYELAAKHHKKAGNLFHAGKAWENAANIHRELKDLSKAIQCFKEGAETLIEDGKLDRAAECLVRATKAIEKDLGKDGKLSEENKKTMSDLFSEALRMYSSGDKYHMSTNTFRAYNTFLLKNGMYDKCIENMKNQNEAYVALNQLHNVYKNNLSMVIVQLHKDGDYNAAYNIEQENLSTYSEYGSSKESERANDLIRAFENNDQEFLDEIIKDPDLKYLEPQVSKIVLKMKIKSMSVQTKRIVSKQDDAKRDELLGGDEIPEASTEHPEEKPEQEVVEEEPEAFDPLDLM